MNPTAVKLAPLLSGGGRPRRLAREFAVAAGEAVYSDRDPAGELYFVLSGRVRILSRAAGRRRKAFEELGPGEFFGEGALVNGRERRGSALAVLDTRLMAVHAVRLKRALAADPALAFRVLRSAAGRLARAHEQIEDLLFCNVLGRVCRMFITLSRRGRSYRGGVLIGDRYSVRELTELLGTTREPMSRAVAALRRLGIVDRRHGLWFIRAPERLSLLCDDRGSVRRPSRRGLRADAGPGHQRGFEQRGRPAY